jgi:hypothetical protein
MRIKALALRHKSRIFARQGRFSAMLMHEFGQINHREVVARIKAEEALLASCERQIAFRS